MANPVPPDLPVNFTPPSFLRISSHSFVVDESIQMGEVLRANTPAKLSASDFFGSQPSGQRFVAGGDDCRGYHRVNLFTLRLRHGISVQLMPQ